MKNTAYTVAIGTVERAVRMDVIPQTNMLARAMIRQSNNNLYAARRTKNANMRAPTVNLLQAAKNGKRALWSVINLPAVSPKGVNDIATNIIKIALGITQAFFGFKTPQAKNMCGYER